MADGSKGIAMDRFLTTARAGSPAEPFALPSRRAALAACRTGLADGGPVLLTGAAGVGKTWLARRIEEDAGRHWILLDTSPGMTPADLLAALAEPIPPTGTIRRALADRLATARAEGRPLALILDEAHLASDELLEEIRLLSNGLGRPDGLDAILIAGQTPLARRMDYGSLSGLESRLAARIHLLALDTDEAAEWLRYLGPRLDSGADGLERWHSETGGNPRRLARLAARGIAVPVEAPRVSAPPASIAPPPEPVAVPPIPRAPESLVPAKPPLRVEDGLIEVGWDAEPEAEATALDASETPSTPLAAGDEEPIDDHYAALQAWEEWAKNQGRSVARPGTATEEHSFEAEIDSDLDSAPSALDETVEVWADERQTFGPYSQLFSRMRPIKGAD